MLYSGNPATNPSMETTYNALILQDYVEAQLASHVTVVQGRLPGVTQDGLEIALTPQEAAQQHLSVGDTVYVQSPYTMFVNGATQYVPWKITLVGLFTPENANDIFWAGNTFTTIATNTVHAGSVQIGALITREGLQAASTQVQHYYPQAQLSQYSPIYLVWEYQLAPSQIDASHMNDLATGLNYDATTLKNLASSSNVQIITVTVPSNVLNSFSQRSSLAQLPEGVLLLLVIGMVLLFIMLMINLLVEQRAEALAVLRSRGASRRQVASAFITQALMLSVPVLLLSPLLAIPVARWLATTLLTSDDQGAINLLNGNPFMLAWSIWPYALAAVGVTCITILLAFVQTTRADVLALRRESARSVRPPFWQRFYVDGALFALAVGGYGYTLYLHKSVTLDDQSNLLIVSPLLLASSAIFLVAILLLFLRFFGQLTALSARVAARRGRSVGSMLALAQIARQPRQATRILLLLTLTTSFTLFSLIFTASQNQRVNSIAAYQVGADFNARLTTVTPENNPNLFNVKLQTPPIESIRQTLAAQTARFQKISGVVSASLGYMGLLGAGDQNYTIKAIDASTFAQTAIWSGEDFHHRWRHSCKCW